MAPTHSFGTAASTALSGCNAFAIGKAGTAEAGKCFLRTLTPTFDVTTCVANADYEMYTLDSAVTLSGRRKLADRETYRQTHT